jgi:putative transposase
MRLAFKHRLCPDRAQADALGGMLAAFCDLYNAAPQQRIEAYRRRGVSLRYGNQASELKAVRAEDERLAGFSFSAEQQVLRGLDKAFAVFFRRLKTTAKCGFPRFQPKSRFDSAEFRVGDGLTMRKTKRLCIGGIAGEIKVKRHRDLPPEAKLEAAVVSRSCGKWHVCFQIAVPDTAAGDRAVALVGIDMGLPSLMALSSGEAASTPPWTAKAAKVLRRAQRAAARKRRRSERQRKAKLRVARRRDFSHKLPRSLANRFTHRVRKPERGWHGARNARQVGPRRRLGNARSARHLQSCKRWWRRRAGRSSRNLADLPGLRLDQTEETLGEDASLRLRMHPRS